MYVCVFGGCVRAYAYIYTHACTYTPTRIYFRILPKWGKTTYYSMVGSLSVAMLAGVNLQCTIIETYSRNFKSASQSQKGVNASHVRKHKHTRDINSSLRRMSNTNTIC